MSRWNGFKLKRGADVRGLDICNEKEARLFVTVANAISWFTGAAPMITKGKDLAKKDSNHAKCLAIDVRIRDWPAWCIVPMAEVIARILNHTVTLSVPKDAPFDSGYVVVVRPTHIHIQKTWFGIVGGVQPRWVIGKASVMAPWAAYKSRYISFVQTFWSRLKR